jgi:nitrate/nitrite transport system substrate-binding protein
VSGQSRENFLKPRYFLYKLNPMATWILSQMKRWGYIKGDVHWKDLSEQVYLLTDARKHMAAMGYKPPTENNKKIIVMGKVFDHTAPDAYIASFAIKRA